MLDFLAECHCFSSTSSSAACHRCSLLSAQCSLLSAISVGYRNVNLVLTVNCEPHCPLSGACSSCKYSSVLLCLKIETGEKPPRKPLQSYYERRASLCSILPLASTGSIQNIVPVTFQVYCYIISDSINILYTVLSRHQDPIKITTFIFKDLWTLLWSLALCSLVLWQYCNIMQLVLLLGCN